MLIAFLAKGTRGDIQPTAVLANALQARYPKLLLHFITHSDHQHWLSEVLGSSVVDCQYLETTPARVWDVQKEDAVPFNRKRPYQTMATPPQPLHSEEDLEQSIAAIQQSLTLAEHGPEHPLPILLIFNLFALEALHIAEALCVPCLAVSPCLVPYTFPSWFPRRFQKAWPGLYDKLQNPHQGQISWIEVEHWLWPSFLPCWTSWRQKRLALPANLCSDYGSASDHKGTTDNMSDNHTLKASTNQPNGSQTKSSDSCSLQQDLTNSSLAASDANYMGAGSSSNSGGQYAGIPLLYGLSEKIVPRPGFWPISVHCCGFWQQKHTSSDHDRKQQLDTLLADALHDCSLDKWRSGQLLLCIDFGSMGCMGLIPHPRHLVAVLTAALHKVAAKAILLTGGWEPLLLAATASMQTDYKSALIAVAGSVPHHLLLPECSAMMHHGGAGTCAAALTAGLPQLVCPFHFDQFSWADRLEYLGVAIRGSTEGLVGAASATASRAQQSPATPALHQQSHEPPTSGTEQQGQGVVEALQAYMSLPAVAQLAGQLKVLLSGQMKEQCQDVQAQLQEEDGISNAVDIIAMYLKHARVPRQGTLAPARPSHANNTQQAVHLHTSPQSPSLDSQSAGASERAAHNEASVTLPNGWTVPACSEVEAMFIYREVVEQQCYLQEGIQISDGDVVMDIGANVGLFTWWVLQNAPDRGQVSKVVAVEPMPQNVAVMQANLQQHGLSSQVQVVSQAVGQAEGEAVFRYYPAMPGNSTCHVVEKQELQRGRMADYFFEGTQDCVCPVTTVSHLLEQHHIQELGLLKVDVEGCELEVLQGIQPQHWALVKQIVMEVHDTAGRLYHVTSLLQAEGYVVECRPGLGPDTRMLYAKQI